MGSVGARRAQRFALVAVTIFRLVFRSRGSGTCGCVLVFAGPGGGPLGSGEFDRQQNRPDTRQRGERPGCHGRCSQSRTRAAWPPKPRVPITLPRGTESIRQHTGPKRHSALTRERRLTSRAGSAREEGAELLDDAVWVAVVADPGVLDRQPIRPNRSSAGRITCCAVAAWAMSLWTVRYSSASAGWDRSRSADDSGTGSAVARRPAGPMSWGPAGVPASAGPRRCRFWCAVSSRAAARFRQLGQVRGVIPAGQLLGHVPPAGAALQREMHIIPVGGLGIWRRSRELRQGDRAGAQGGQVRGEPGVPRASVQRREPPGGGGDGGQRPGGRLPVHVHLADGLLWP